MTLAQNSGVLIVGPVQALSLKDFGADRVSHLRAAREYLKTHQPDLLVFGHEEGEDLNEFCSYVNERAPTALWIINSVNLPPKDLIEWTNSGRLHALIESFDDPDLETILQTGLEASGEIRQRQKLVEMFTEQSQTLKRLSTELETRVEKRHKTLRKSKQTLEGTKGQLESFHKALLGIHRASSILQMEQTLNEALHHSVNMVWVRVRFESQSLLRRQIAENVLAIDIPFAQEKLRGEVMFSKADGHRFTPTETDFLHELTEALALALARLHKLEQAETVKAQWQATFDSIPHALCLTGVDGAIFKMNRAFQLACRSESFQQLIGKNCFEVFFGPDFHPPAQMLSPFSFRNSRSGRRATEHFEVIGETLGLTVDQQPTQLILLRSITDEVRFERRILEASKLAELGTIGSSIAHELNNPLGGMLSFLQLILMDLKKEDPLYADIKEMEKAVLRCRDIVINLLSFARKQDLGQFSEIDLWTVVERAVKLIELQSKSKGIVIEIVASPPAQILGSANALAQALCNVLQNSIDAISDKLTENPLYPGRITIRIDSASEHYQLRISDNGAGIRPEDQTQIFNPLFTTRDSSHFSGMGLTTAFTIVSEHRGRLEILSQTGSGTTAILSFEQASTTSSKTEL